MVLVMNPNVAVAPDISSLGATVPPKIPVAVAELGVSGVTKLTIPVLPRQELLALHDLHVDAVTYHTLKIPNSKRTLDGI